MTRHPSASYPDRPLIGVTATVRVDDGVSRLRLTSAYLEILERAGLVPIVIPPFTGDVAAVAAAVGRVLDVVDGLVLTGGEDVDPLRYGAVRSPHVTRIQAARDAMEIAAVFGARDRSLPTLAICRGIQVLNVALGGTLIQDIPSEWSGALVHEPEAPRDLRTHPVELTAGSRVARALGRTKMEVNSVHHQSIARVSTALVVTGMAPDGIIEAVETAANDPWWVLGAQWHPEEFVSDGGAADHGLFAALGSAIERGAVAAR